MLTFPVHQWIAHYGVFALGALSFVAATILPLSSEVIMIAGIKAGIPVVDALIACSIGNCSACLCNYAIGLFIREKMHSRLEQSRSGRLALRWTERHGIWSLLLSWLPIIGDPLTIVAGMVRVRLFLFILIVFSLRILRYIMIAGIV